MESERSRVLVDEVMVLVGVPGGHDIPLAELVDLLRSSRLSITLLSFQEFYRAGDLLPGHCLIWVSKEQISGRQ